MRFAIFKTEPNQTPFRANARDWVVSAFPIPLAARSSALTLGKISPHASDLLVPRLHPDKGPFPETLFCAVSGSRADPHDFRARSDVREESGWFITETRDNPKFRDKRIGKDRYRRMPEKLVDLSRSFIRTAVTLHKDGEFDDRYFVRIAPSKGCSGVFTIGGEKLDELVESLREIIVDQESPRQPTKR